MTVTPTPARQVTPGTRIRVAGTAYWVRDAKPADDGGALIELDNHDVITVPPVGMVEVIGKPAAVAS